MFSQQQEHRAGNRPKRRPPQGGKNEGRMRDPSQLEATSQTKIGDQPTSIIAATGIIAQLAMASIKAVGKLP
jgi:hypothetical protein